MPLIKKGILVEGQDGMHEVLTYYENEKPKNPYSDERKRREKERGARARAFIKRRTQSHEKGTTTYLGYNHCISTYSQPGKYCPFSGSSLNRDKKYRDDKTKSLEGSAGAALAVAFKKARPYYKRCLNVPEPIDTFIRRPSSKAAGGLRLWISRQDDRPADGISLPIYELSARSRGKIKDKATAFFRASPRERVFCTLTFIAPVDDQTGVSILNKFLTGIRKKYVGLQYLWVAERQDNGNIHFHIILNKRLPVRRYNALWVMQQYNSGLRGKTKYGEPVSMAEIKERFEDDTVHRVFNPVDLRRVKSIAGLSAYLTKYITKQKRGAYFSCAPWHCSRGVSRLFIRAVVSRSCFSNMMSWRNCRLCKSTGEVFLPEVVRPSGPGGAFCMLVYINKKDEPLKYLREMEQINKWLIKNVPLEGNLDVIDDDFYRRIICKN